jgi:ABC-type transporter Mla subunit MlaD
METRGAAVRTGLFVIGGILVLLAAIFVLSGGPFQRGVIYESYFSESVQGLDVGSPVKYRGVTIGKVSDIGLVSVEYPPANPDEMRKSIYHQVVVRYRVEVSKVGRVPRIKEAIPLGLRAQIAPQGITGLAYVELSFNKNAGTPQQVPWTPRHTVIPSTPSTLTRVTDAVQHFLTDVESAQFGKTMEQISGLIAAVNQEFTKGDARQAMANANTLLKQVQTTLKQADIAGTTALLAKLDRSATALNQASAQLPALIASSEKAVRTANDATASLTRQMLPIIRNLQQVSQNLDDLSQTLAANPSSVLRGRPPPPEYPQH